MPSPASNVPSTGPTGAIPLDATYVGTVGDPPVDPADSPPRVSSQPTTSAEALDATYIESTPSDASQPDPPQPRRSTKQLGDFRLVRKLGQGAMGEVFLARRQSDGRLAAVKVLSRPFAAREESVRRFYREAKAMARLDHAHAVKVYAVDREADVHFVAMEYVDGRSLGDWLKTLGRLSVPDAVHVALRCAEALRQAHALNLVHRDVKPDNIMLTASGMVKVSDFGLAKATDDEEGALTRGGTGLGTPYYMAPEQARNARDVDGRCDVYALGVTLYQLLTGELPFGGNSQVELIINKEEGTFPAASSLNADIPVALDDLIDSMLATDPGDRCPNFDEVITVLESLKLPCDSLSFIPGPNRFSAADAKGRKGAPASGSAPARNGAGREAGARRGASSETSTTVRRSYAVFRRVSGPVGAAIGLTVLGGILYAAVRALS